jgi:hypothetical protein
MRFLVALCVYAQTRPKACLYCTHPLMQMDHYGEVMLRRKERPQGRCRKCGKKVRGGYTMCEGCRVDCPTRAGPRASGKGPTAAKP